MKFRSFLDFSIAHLRAINNRRDEIILSPGQFYKCMLSNSKRNKKYTLLLDFSELHLACSQNSELVFHSSEIK